MDVFYSVFADSDIQPYLFEPEYTAEEMQRREVEQEDMAGGTPMHAMHPGNM